MEPEEFDENHLKPNEIIIGPFYTTYGDDTAIYLTCTEFHIEYVHTKWWWKPQSANCFIDDNKVRCLPVNSKNPKYVFKRKFIGKEGNLNKYDIIIRIKTEGYHAVGSMPDPWFIAEREQTKDPFLMFVRVHKGKIIAQEKFGPVENETEKQYKMRLWDEIENIIDRLFKIK